MKTYNVDCFTEKYAKTRFPEASFEADTLEEVSDIIHNCSREIAGIRVVEVWINKTHNLKARGDI
jgi:hypothetical protein